MPPKTLKKNQSKKKEINRCHRSFHHNGAIAKHSVSNLITTEDWQSWDALEPARQHNELGVRSGFFQALAFSRMCGVPQMPENVVLFPRRLYPNRGPRDAPRNRASSQKQVALRSLFNSDARATTVFRDEFNSCDLKGSTNSFYG